MPYVDLALPPATPPEIAALVRDHIDPLLADVHAMLRLPKKSPPGLDAGCNLSALTILLNVVSGVSMEIHDPTGKKFGKDEQRFKFVVRERFPWSQEPKTGTAIVGSDAANILYKAFRNPLTHNLGLIIDTNYAGDRKVAAKGPLSDRDIMRIEQSAARPQDWARPTLEAVPASGGETGKTRLVVKALYWCIRRMIHDVVADRVAAVSAPSVGSHRVAVYGSTPSAGVTPLPTTSVGSGSIK